MLSSFIDDDNMKESCTQPYTIIGVLNCYNWDPQPFTEKDHFTLFIRSKVSLVLKIVILNSSIHILTICSFYKLNQQLFK